MKIDDIRALADKHQILLIYLFGSQAEKGRKYLEGEHIMPDTYSDLDIAVALETAPTDTMNTYGILYREISNIFDPFSIDLLFMHEVNPLFQYEIIREKRIFAKDESYADDFEERIMKMAADLSFKKRTFNNEIIEAIEDGYFEFEYRPNH
jgi:predicted nucleotidyltransferase